MEEKPHRQGGFDRNVRVLPLCASRAVSVRLPGGDRLRGQPDGDVAAPDQGAIIRAPVLKVIPRLVRWMNSRLLDPSSVGCPPRNLTLDLCTNALVRTRGRERAVATGAQN